MFRDAKVYYLTEYNAETEKSIVEKIKDEIASHPSKAIWDINVAIHLISATESFKRYRIFSQLDEIDNFLIANNAEDSNGLGIDITIMIDEKEDPEPIFGNSSCIRYIPNWYEIKNRKRTKI